MTDHSNAAQRAEWERLVQTLHERGWRGLGWVAHRFEELFGVPPPPEWDVKAHLAQLRST